jgi:hypothetical protein
MNKVGIGRVVLTNREHIIALEPLDKGLMGTLLRSLTGSCLRKTACQSPGELRCVPIAPSACA